MTGRTILLVAAATALVASACTTPDGRPPDASPPAPSSSTTSSVDANADEALRGELYGIALARLVTTDNTFGEGFRFTEILVQTSTDPGAGGAERRGERRPLTDAERAGIETALAPLGSFRWIDDPETWRTPDLMPVVEGSAIVGVGEVRFRDGVALVPVSLWCGGLCGLSATYRLVRTGGGWQVEGFEGPVAIS